jgi:L-lactate dehydrogenase complex protein LldE
VDQFQPETARNTLKVLQRVGCGVNYNIEQTCCGQPAYEDGYRDHCKEVGDKLIREFPTGRFKDELVDEEPYIMDMKKNLDAFIESATSKIADYVASNKSKIEEMLLYEDDAMQQFIVDARKAYDTVCKYSL